MVNLTKYDLERYDRQIRIEGFGEEGQRKLKEAEVFIAGAGGLGFSASIYLAAAGIGKIKIVDNDTVELSNLNRQLLHWDWDIGKRKVDSTYEKLTKINPSIEIKIYDEKITQDNILELLGNADAIVDAMDNYSTRYILNKASLKRGIPFFHGAVRSLYGQVTTIIPKKTFCLRCIIPEAPLPEISPILGTVAGTIGAIEATEVIKYFTNIGKLLENELLIYDGWAMEFERVKLQKNPSCPDCSQI
jgi:adenylyltransferase/sulfurtransferase